MSSAHSPTFPSLHLSHNSFSNTSVASPTSQFILQPFFRFSYVTSSSFNSPGEPPMVDSHPKFPTLMGAMGGISVIFVKNFNSIEKIYFTYYFL